MSGSIQIVTRISEQMEKRQNLIWVINNCFCFTHTHKHSLHTSDITFKCWGGQRQDMRNEWGEKEMQTGTEEEGEEKRRSIVGESKNHAQTVVRRGRWGVQTKQGGGKSWFLGLCLPGISDGVETNRQGAFEVKTGFSTLSSHIWWHSWGRDGGEC